VAGQQVGTAEVGVAGERVRLRDVARLAGVSPTTASAVLTGRHVEMRIAGATQQRVREAAAELGYRPNLAARSLRMRSSRLIGLVSDTIAADPYAGEMLRGALAAALSHDHLLVIAESDSDRRTEDDLVRGMVDRQVDGLVYGCFSTREVELSELVRGVPVTLLNCLADPLPGPAVIPDEVQGGRVAARCLLDAGHRGGIHLVGDRPRSVFAARERSRGIRAELQAAGVAPPGEVDCDWTPQDARLAVGRLLARVRPSALICLNDRIALGAYQAAQEAGLRIPDDLSVVAFDDSVLAGWLAPGLSSVALPHHEMGRLATDLLIKGDRHPAVHRIEMLLRHRDSVAAPAAGRG
jgi:LacI family transcriptional regulator